MPVHYVSESAYPEEWRAIFKTWNLAELIQLARKDEAFAIKIRATVDRVQLLAATTVAHEKKITERSLAGTFDEKLQAWFKRFLAQGNLDRVDKQFKDLSMEADYQAVEARATTLMHLTSAELIELGEAIIDRVTVDDKSDDDVKANEYDA